MNLTPEREALLQAYASQEELTKSELVRCALRAWIRLPTLWASAPAHQLIWLPTLNIWLASEKATALQEQINTAQEMSKIYNNAPISIADENSITLSNVIDHFSRALKNPPIRAA